MASAGFPRELLGRPWPERLAYFGRYTVAHPKLNQAKDALLWAIRSSAPNSLIFVLGPTGVGKTTLRLKLEQVLAQELAGELTSDPARLPVVSLEAVAPEARGFNWREHFRRLLVTMEEPLVAYKMNPNQHAAGPPATFRPSRKPNCSDYHYAVEQALRYRRPLAVFIDEAQHLARIPSGRKLADQLDVIKSVASHTNTVHVLFGTYDLLAFRNLSGQLSRRSLDIHLDRYRAELAEERTIFWGVLRSFERHLPLAEPPDLIRCWEYMYERSMGCVGVLKEWLVRAVATAAQQDSATLTRHHLRTSALSLSQCSKMLAEMLDGEDQLLESDDQVSQFRVRLGLQGDLEEGSKTLASLLAAPSSDPAEQHRRRRRPGERRPQRDAVGIAPSSHAA